MSTVLAVLTNSDEPCADSFRQDRKSFRVGEQHTLEARFDATASKAIDVFMIPLPIDRRYEREQRVL